MGVPTAEVGYTPVMPRREDHEVHKDMWWHWGRNKRDSRIEVFVGALTNNMESILTLTLV